jgi:hypothetical protein
MKQREFRSTGRPGDRPFSYLRQKPDELQAAVDEELRVHLEMCVEELIEGDVR